MQTQKGKPRRQWEVLKLRTDVRIEGQQFGSFQFSQEEIIIFGSNFKSEFPHFSEMQIYKFNHDQKQVIKVKDPRTQRQSISYQGQQMQTMHRTNFQQLYDDLDEDYGMFQFGFFSDTITTFEKSIITIPQLISRNPENVQVYCLDIRDLSNY